LNRFENRIKIEGAVFRPGYSFTKACAFRIWLHKADGLKEDAYRQRADHRLKTDLTTEIVINVDLESALGGNMAADIALKKEDVVTVYSVLTLLTIKLQLMERLKPGTLTIMRLTLNDLLIQAGGLTGSASKEWK
jgi:protein involved in polysaccharide export with SLBB domain